MPDSPPGPRSAPAARPRRRTDGRVYGPPQRHLLLVGAPLVAVAVAAILAGVPAVAFMVAGVAYLRCRAGRRYRLLTARRCAALASLDIDNANIGEELIVGDLAAIAGHVGLIESASRRTWRLEDPWRRLLSVERLEKAHGRATRRRTGSAARVHAAAALAVLIGGIVGAVAVDSPVWAIAAALSGIAAATAVDEAIWQQRLIVMITLRSATDPISGAAPTEDELLSTICACAGHSYRIVYLAARKHGDDIDTLTRLMHALARCRRVNGRLGTVRSRSR
jgi:hypothetical protein